MKCKKCEKDSIAALTIQSEDETTKKRVRTRAQGLAATYFRRRDGQHD